MKVSLATAPIAPRSQDNDRGKVKVPRRHPPAPHHLLRPLLTIVPWVGEIAGWIGSAALLAIGVREVHGTTTGRAALTVLLPFLLAAGLFGLAWLIAVGRRRLRPLVIALYLVTMPFSVANSCNCGASA